MATYPLRELLSRWQQGTLTVEQAIGQILQHLLALEKRHRQAELDQDYFEDKNPACQIESEPGFIVLKYCPDQRLGLLLPQKPEMLLLHRIQMRH